MDSNATAAMSFTTRLKAEAEAAARNAAAVSFTQSLKAEAEATPKPMRRAA